MKLKSLLTLASIFAGIFLVTMTQTVVSQNPKEPGYAEQWEGFTKDILSELDLPIPSSKPGKYLVSAGAGVAAGVAPGALIAASGNLISRRLAKSAEKAENAGFTAASYSYQALSNAVYLAGYAAGWLTTILAGPTLAAYGVAGSLAIHALADITDLFSEVKTKLDNNQLSPQEAIKLAEQLEADTKELKEHTANAQQAAA